MVLRMLWSFSASSNARTPRSRSQPPRTAPLSSRQTHPARRLPHAEAAPPADRRTRFKLVGLRVERIVRRGKYLLFDCESENGGGWLILHLGMSGSLRLLAPRPLCNGTTMPTSCLPIRRCAIATRGASASALARRRKRRAPSADRPARHRALVRRLRRQLLFDATRRRNRADQDRADGQPPDRRHRQHLRFGKPVSGRHFAAARGLGGSVSNAAASSRRRSAARSKARSPPAAAASADYVHSDGGAGYFQLSCAVYDRCGEPCRTCGTPIRQIRQQGRSTYYCPRCQR